MFTISPVKPNVVDFQHKKLFTPLEKKPILKKTNVVLFPTDFG